MGKSHVMVSWDRIFIPHTNCFWHSLLTQFRVFCLLSQGQIGSSCAIHIPVHIEHPGGKALNCCPASPSPPNPPSSTLPPTVSAQWPKTQKNCHSHSWDPPGACFILTWTPSKLSATLPVSDGCKMMTASGRLPF